MKYPTYSRLIPDMFRGYVRLLFSAGNTAPGASDIAIGLTIAESTSCDNTWADIRTYAEGRGWIVNFDWRFESFSIAEGVFVEKYELQREDGKPVGIVLAPHKDGKPSGEKAVVLRVLNPGIIALMRTTGEARPKPGNYCD